MENEHDFFDRFFDDTPRFTCANCGSKENLSPLGSATGGAQLYICPNCKAKRDAESQKRIDIAHQQRCESERRDRWEDR